MRFRGGGVGHTSTRNATNHFLADRHCTNSEFQHDIELELEETQNMPERSEFNSSLDSNSDNDGDSEELAYVQVDDEVEDYGYERSDYSESSNESDDGRRWNDGSDVEEDEIEQLGYARF